MPCGVQNLTVNRSLKRLREERCVRLNILTPPAKKSRSKLYIHIATMRIIARNLSRLAPTRLSQPAIRRTIATPAQRLFATPTLSSSQLSFRRFQSTPAKPTEELTKPAEDPAQPDDKAIKQPSYQITFTCKPCSERSTHVMTKQAYHHGSVLITCPKCKNRHVIADHLNVSLLLCHATVTDEMQMFGDDKITIEDLMRERGEVVRKGVIGGDLEFVPKDLADNVQ
jgi:protein import protein ZIM17